MEKIKPVLRWVGSKYKKIDKIIESLDIKKEDHFLDLFSGSGIVGVNVKHLIGCDVTINDYDNIFPIKKSFAIKNMISFQGLGTHFTQSAFEYFVKRVKNGYWEKLEIYNNILKECSNLKKEDALIILKELGIFIGGPTQANLKMKIYVDPPYHSAKKIYIHEINHTSFHSALNELLNDIKRDNKILISYNDCPEIRELYKDWNINTWDYKYSTGTKSQQKNKGITKELVITNY